MSTLVRHFGDFADSKQACGICDFCAPAECIAQRFRAPTKVELAGTYRVIRTLRSGDSKSTGKLHTEIFPHSQLDRDGFEELLGAMARAGLVQLTDAVFEKDGRTIPYRKAALGREAAGVDENTPVEIQIKDASFVAAKPKRKKKASVSTAKAKPSAVIDRGLEERLRAWRKDEAKRKGVPAFRIFNDRILMALVENRPSTARELMQIPGMNMGTVRNLGSQIYTILGSGA